MITPITRLPPPTYSPKVSTTLPGSPVPKISLVEDMFSAIRNKVVNSNSVGKKDKSNTSFTNIVENNMVKEIAILNAKSTSKSQFGSVMMNIKNAVNTYMAMTTSYPIFFIVLLPS